MKKHYRDKKWNSLTEFKAYLERTKEETIQDFDGTLLITNKGRYGLVHDHLIFIEKGDTSNA